ncbi:unnamed protein product [Heligmosomoides polygyrus]|uniref:Uncharacterized protein n=1 Tax=Heligmosomoides polygyrus TaxID=6339 RepID=A0A3P8DU73_HELPZ|nr:unnamed protein product [Heligmosomoides polygyrus]
MLADFDRVCGNVELQLNLTKTMFMRNGWVSDAPFSLNGTNISECSSYVYLAYFMKNGTTSLVLGFTLIFWVLFSVVSQWHYIYTAKGMLSYEEIEEKVFRPNNFRIRERCSPVPKLEFINKPTCEHYIYTAKGMLPYEEIEEKVFRPNNFRIRERCSPVPKLEFINKPTCESIFEEWLQIATTKNDTSEPPRRIPIDLLNQFLLNGYAFIQIFEEWLQIATTKNDTSEPPRRIPIDLLNQFLLNGYAFIQHRYLDNRISPEPLIWDDLPELLYYEPDKLTRYGEQGLSIYYALLDYPLLGKVGFVIGSQSAWVEAQALISGARKVFTIEYQRIIIQGDHNITYIHPIDFATEWRRYENTFDFAISFSSIEHSGLGR